MLMILTIAGIFAGIGIFLAAMYSMTQVLLLSGWGRIAHGVCLALIMAIMFVLFFYNAIALAQVIAFALFGVGIWTFVLERRWYRVFPVIVMVFALMLILGYVALNPV